MKKFLTFLLSLSLFGQSYAGEKEILDVEFLSPSTMNKIITTIHPQVVIDCSSSNFLDPQKQPEIDFHFLEENHEIFVRKNKTYKRLKNQHVYEGNPTTLLQSLSPNLKGNVLLVVDADQSLPKKIASLSKNSLENSSFLLPNIQKLSSREIQEIKTDLQQINSKLEFHIFGDFALAYTSTDLFSPSPLSEAMTVSQLEEVSFERILEAEKAIIHSFEKQHEKKVLCDLIESKKSTHTQLWKALSLIGEKNYFEASRCLHKLESEGYDHWRMYWYIAQVEYERRNLNEAGRAIKLVLREAPNFNEAQSLFEKIQDEL